MRLVEVSPSATTLQVEALEHGSPCENWNSKCRPVWIRPATATDTPRCTSFFLTTSVQALLYPTRAKKDYLRFSPTLEFLPSDRDGSFQMDTSWPIYASVCWTFRISSLQKTIVYCCHITIGSAIATSTARIACYIFLYRASEKS